MGYSLPSVIFGAVVYSFVDSQYQIRVVIVEGSPIIRVRLSEALSEISNVELIAAVDSEQAALRLLRSSGWNAMVLDLQLKEGTGFGILKALDVLRPEGAKVIVFSNYVYPAYRQRCLKLGADHFFDKARELHRVRDVLAQMATSGSSQLP